ncbi:MAG: hypothetical protein ACRDOI_29440 [Trebonia sp.]
MTRARERELHAVPEASTILHFTGAALVLGAQGMPLLAERLMVRK